MQSRVVVDEGEEVVEIDVVGVTELETVAVVVVKVGAGVVGHGLDCVSTLQDALQYAM